MHPVSSNKVPSDLINGERSGHNPLDWWYRLAALPDALYHSSLEEREHIRRSRVAANVLFGIFCILIVTIFLGFIVQKPVISGIMFAGFCLVCVCTFLNHRGYVMAAGVILLVQVDGGQILVFTHIPGGLDLAHMMLLDQLFVIGAMVGVTFFPSGLIFVSALFNCLVLALVMWFAPSTREFYGIAHSLAGIQYYIDPLAVQGIVAIVFFLWTRSMNKAIERDDREYIIATLENQIAYQLEVVGKEKELIEQSIQLILDVHMRVTNGDLGARVPLSQDNVLWPIASSLNTLLSRYRQFYMGAYTYQQLEVELKKFIRLVHNAKQRSVPIYVEPTGTILDALYSECNGHILAPYQGPAKNPDAGSITNPGAPRTNPGLRTDPGAPRTNPGFRTDPGAPRTNPGLRTDPGAPYTNPEVPRIDLRRDS